jgi:hypothetical protein
VAIRYYMDVHVTATITDGLRQRGVDVLTSQEDGTREVPDEQLLARATELGRVLFSQDTELLRIAHQWASFRPIIRRPDIRSSAKLGRSSHVQRCTDDLGLLRLSPCLLLRQIRPW